MKKIVFSVCAVAAMGRLVFAAGDSVEPPVEEVSGFYAGLGITAVSTRGSELSVDLFNTKEGHDRLGNVSFLAGYNFNEYIAAEGRYSTSFTHDEDIEMEGWSLFVKPQYPLNKDFSVYALLGYGGVNLEGSKYLRGAVNVDDSTFQWGVGMHYRVMENVSLFTDYTWLAKDMDGAYAGVYEVDVDAFTIGVNYSF